MGDSPKALAGIGSCVKSIEHGNNLYMAFQLQSASGGAGDGLVQVTLKAKEKAEKPSEKKADTKTKTVEKEEEKEILEIDDSENKTEEASEQKEKSLEINYDALSSEVVFTSCIPDESLNKEELLFYVANGAMMDLSDLATMSTSTALDYIIASSGHHVFVCPLDENGKILSAGVVEDFYSNPNFINRKHKSGGQVPFIRSFDVEHTIQSLQVVGDTIYIKHKNIPGVYSYRAVFNDDGSIGGWATSEHFAAGRC